MFIDDNEGTQDAALTNQALIDTQERLGALLDLMPTGLIIHQMQGILYANQQARHLLKQSEEALIGQHILDYVPDDAHETCSQNFLESFNSPTAIRFPEIMMEAVDGSIHYVRMTAGRLPWEGTSVIQILLEDITELRQQANELRKLTYHDPLTGAFNRRYFIKHAEASLQRAIEQDNPFSLLIFDLDWFKQVNDSRGHLAGDEALKSILKVWQENTRHNDFSGRKDDNTLARIGGEEFAIYLPNVELDQALLIAERMRQSLEDNRITFEGAQFSITASFGMTSRQKEDKNLDDLIRRADGGLYKAKKNGRNRVIAE